MAWKLTHLRQILRTRTLLLLFAVVLAAFAVAQIGLTELTKPTPNATDQLSSYDQLHATGVAMKNGAQADPEQAFSSLLPAENGISVQRAPAPTRLADSTTGGAIATPYNELPPLIGWPPWMPQLAAYPGGS